MIRWANKSYINFNSTWILQLNINIKTKIYTGLNSSPIDECGDGAWVYVEAASKRDR